MSTGSPSPQADSLSKLRIRRDQPPRGPSLFGRLLRFLLLTGTLAGIAAGVWFFAFSGGVFPDATKLMESVRPKPEVRVAIVSVETGLSADATVVATGYIESRQQARIGAPPPDAFRMSMSKRARKSPQMTFSQSSNMQTSTPHSPPPKLPPLAAAANFRNRM
jgi:hypothetical protein